jgi:hypothetical protein
LRQNEGVTLPPEALYIIRHHSLYPWHDGGCYELFENAHDRSMKGWVKLFNQHVREKAENERTATAHAKCTRRIASL